MTEDSVHALTIWLLGFTVGVLVGALVIPGVVEVLGL